MQNPFGKPKSIETIREVTVLKERPVNKSMKTELEKVNTTIKECKRLLAPELEQHGLPTDIDLEEMIKAYIHAHKDGE